MTFFMKLYKHYPSIVILLFFGLGIILGFLDIPIFLSLSEDFGELFLKYLKFISLPLIFFSLISTVSGFKSKEDLLPIAKKTLFYTFFTTTLAASVALVLYVLIKPAQVGLGSLTSHGSFPNHSELLSDQKSSFSFLWESIPSDLFSPFMKGNVFGVFLIAIVLSIGILFMRKDERAQIARASTTLFALILILARGIIYFMPLAIMTFSVVLVNKIKNGFPVQTVLYYFICILLANLLQGLIVLPGLLKLKGIKPWQLFLHMKEALLVAFFSKSSSAALPFSLKCAENNAKMKKEVTRFSFPICTTINMNGCAAFILITVLFVSEVNGLSFAFNEKLGWMFIAIIAAVGNAAVPMGCYLLASSFLASSGVPLELMGVILPIYGLIDMVETALNVWSDSTVTAMVNKEFMEDT